MTDKDDFTIWVMNTGGAIAHDNVAWSAWQAALKLERSKAPAWKDAPDAPGLWVVGSRCLHINELDLPIYARSNCRWYGPLPEDAGGKA